MVPLYAARVQDLGPVSLNQFSSSNLVSGGFPDSLSFRPIALLMHLISSGTYLLRSSRRLAGINRRLDRGE
jgi:hypothetical protein